MLNITANTKHCLFKVTVSVLLVRITTVQPNSFPFVFVFLVLTCLESFIHISVIGQKQTISFNETAQKDSAQTAPIDDFSKFIARKLQKKFTII